MTSQARQVQCAEDFEDCFGVVPVESHKLKQDLQVGFEGGWYAGRARMLALIAELGDRINALEKDLVAAKAGNGELRNELKNTQEQLLFYMAANIQ